jgi:polar amino acid transport system substrate-binding protein
VEKLYDYSKGITKKIVLLGIIAVLASALAVGCSGGSAGAEESEPLTKLEQIQKDGKIILGTAADYPPYEFHAMIDGKDTVVGFDIEIAKVIAEKLGVELVITDMKFDGLLAAMNANKVDFIISGMTPTEERSKSVDFSEPYYNPYQTILVLDEMKDTFNTFESFEGNDIGAQKSSIQEALANDKFANSKIKVLPKITDLVLELKTGKIDGVILAEPVASAYIKENPDLALNGMDLGNDDVAAIAVPKDSSSLLEEINVILKELKDSGKLGEFLKDANEING